MKIISRYVLKEHLGPLVFSLSALTSLLLLNYIAKQFGNLVGKGLPWTVILEFFALSVPFTVAMTLPMAVLISTLYAFSRLAGENEITALKANGVSLSRTLVPVLLGASVLAAIMVGFNDQVLPRANHRLSTLLSDIQRKKPTFALREQVINEVVTRKFFLRANHIQDNNRLREITIYDFGTPTARRTIHADSGRMALSADQRDLIMTLYSGYMVEVPRNEPHRLQRLFFEEDRIRVSGIGNQLERSEGRVYKSDREMSICEMHAELAKARRDREAARFELEDLLVSVARRAATGEQPARRTPPDPGEPSGLSRAYCAVLAGIGGVTEAVAADSRPGPQVPPSAGGFSPASGFADRSFAERRYELESPASVRGIIDAMRGRVRIAQDTMNSYDVEIHKKFALAVACVVFVLLGAPIALRFPRGGVGLVMTVSLIVFGLYYVGLIAGEALANRGTLSPFVAMWLANIVFSLVGLVLLLRMGRETSTTRGGDLGELLEMVRLWVAGAGRRVGIPLERRRRPA